MPVAIPALVTCCVCGKERNAHVIVKNDGHGGGSLRGAKLSLLASGPEPWRWVPTDERGENDVVCGKQCADAHMAKLALARNEAPAGQGPFQVTGGSGGNGSLTGFGGPYNVGSTPTGQGGTGGGDHHS